MGGDNTPPNTFKEDHMKEKLFTLVSSKPKFRINPELTEYLHTTGNISLKSQDDVHVRRNYELTYVDETQCCFVKNNIEQLIIDVSNMTEQEYDKLMYWFVHDPRGDRTTIPIFIQTVPKNEYKTLQWVDVNEFIQLTLLPEFDFKCVVESFAETTENIMFIVRYLAYKVPGEDGGIFGRFEKCCVSLNKNTGEVRVEFGYDPYSHEKHTIRTYQFDDVLVSRYELN